MAGYSLRADTQRIFQLVLSDFKKRGDRKILVVYDVDDLMWPLTKNLARKGGIDVDAATSTFMIKDNQLLTPKERQYIIDGFGKVENFYNIQFYDGVKDILKPRDLGAKVVINSNSFSPAISEAKTEQLLAAVPGLKRSDIQMNHVSYTSAQSKKLHQHITFLAEDSPYNIAIGDALCNVVPSYMTWSVCMDAVKAMVGRRVVARSSFAEIVQFIYDGVKYIVENQ